MPRKPKSASVSSLRKWNSSPPNSSKVGLQSARPLAACQRGILLSPEEKHFGSAETAGRTAWGREEPPFLIADDQAIRLQPTQCHREGREEGSSGCTTCCVPSVYSWADPTAALCPLRLTHPHSEGCLRVFSAHLLFLPPQHSPQIKKRRCDAL